jgi:hypothetical protein
MQSRTFCVYEHWREDKNVCFYVGKGHLKRARQISRKENTRHQRIVSKLKSLNMNVIVRIVQQNMVEEDAFILEVERIAYWRRMGTELSNQTNGGDGSSGYVYSEERRKEVSERMRGIKKPQLQGKGLSEEHRKRISDGLKGSVVSQETRNKISAAQKGKPRPENIGRKISQEGIERLRNRVFTEQHRRRISLAKKGVPVPEERRIRISETLKRKNNRETEANEQIN